MKRWVTLFAVLLLMCVCAPAQAAVDSCDKIVEALNAKLSPAIDEAELVDVLQTLNATSNKKLPDKFVTKAQARKAGWRPGRDLWSVKALKGSSMGGDRFGNFEGRLPKGQWREADLDYQGGKRGGKRLVFSKNGKRFVSVDHYETFTEVPTCR